MSLNSYRDLRVWQQGMALAEDCYRLTRSFPKEEMFGMTSQIRRASSRIPSNIAEGYGRGHRGEYFQFLRVAQGCLKELETHLLLSVQVELTEPISVTPIVARCDDVGKMLGALIRFLDPK
jgi:four helix bundle protein